MRASKIDRWTLGLIARLKAELGYQVLYSPYGDPPYPLPEYVDKPTPANTPDWWKYQKVRGMVSEIVAEAMTGGEE